MTHRFLMVACALFVASLPTPAYAQWSGKGELGWVMARGNTDTDTLNGKVDAKDESGDWTYLLGASALHARTSGASTADRYELHGQANYKLTSESYVLSTLRYENDKFSPYNYQATATVGYGYKIIDTEPTKLSVEAGPGYRRLEDRPSGETEGRLIARGAVNFEHAFNAATKLTEKFLIESGSDDTFISNDLALAVKMTTALALSVDYQILHNSTIPPGAASFHKTDQLTTVNAVFSF